jgi:MFS superfamily sulfate permease-like transporter
MKSTQQGSRMGTMNLRTLALVLLALFLVASLPKWSHSIDWGYLPSGVFALLFATVVILLLTRRI